MTAGAARPATRDRDGDGGGAPGARALARAGWRAVADHTGTVLALFAVHALVAAGAAFVIARILAARFAYRPLFDEAVDGDLAALVEALRGAPATIQAIGWIGAGAVLLWVMLGWFLSAGLIGVLAAGPQGRGEAARRFGAAGAAHLLVFARLAAVSLIAYAGVTIVAALGLDAVAPRIDRALTPGAALGAVVLGLTPALLLLLAVWTVVDHARVELVLRRADHPELGAVRALARAAVFVARRPLAYLHVLAWAGAWIAIGAGYAWAAHGQAMLGASGAVALLVVRQGVVLARLALRVALVGGQVELGRKRPPPPGPAPSS